MKNLLAILLLFGISLTLQGQNWDYYKPLESRGSIPDDFTEAYINKYEREKQQISQHSKRKSRQRQDDFYRRSEFFVNEYLVSGNVLFGDTISQYCEKILDLLLKDDPKLRRKLRVYTVKSPVVNASATGNGIIFVNLGLLAEVENEAQLAYILAHEVMHYKNDHVMNQYVEQEKISNGEDLYRRTDGDEKLLALSTYSKTQELEADEEGFLRYYQNSGYSQIEALHVMDILLYSYLPFDELVFEKSTLETGNYVIPEYYLLNEVAPITAEEDYDDSESTHPNIKTRRETLDKIISVKDQGALYQISEEGFKFCQRSARYEMSRLYLNRLMYPEAIYHTFLLGKKYGVDRYQRLTIAKALHASSVYRNDSDLDDIINEWEDVEGESQQVFHIFDKFEKKDLNTLAVSYAYQLYKDYPEDKAVERIFKRCLYDLVYENEMRPSDYLKKLPDTSNIEAVDTAIDVTSTRSSKISKIKKKKSNEEEELEDEEYYRIAFVDFFADSLFTTIFTQFADDAEEEGSQSKNYRSRSKYDENIALGIDRVVSVTPVYLKLDERERDGIRYITTDERLENYRKQLVDVARIARLDFELLDYKTLGLMDVQTYNDISLMKNWIAERISHGNTDAIISDFDNMDDLRERYGTDYLTYTGNLSLRNKEKGVAAELVFSILIPYILPFAILDLATPDYDSFNFFFLFDMRNGDALLAEVNYYETKDSDDYLRSIIYNHLIQIKDKPKQ